MDSGIDSDSGMDLMALARLPLMHSMASTNESDNTQENSINRSTLGGYEGQNRGMEGRTRGSPLLTDLTLDELSMGATDVPVRSKVSSVPMNHKTESSSNRSSRSSSHGLKEGFSTRSQNHQRNIQFSHKQEEDDVDINLSSDSSNDEDSLLGESFS